MAIVRADIGVTLDGYASGLNQRLDAPFGDLDHKRLHAWMFDHAEENADEIAGILGAGAYLMGRNMFDPGRGEWDVSWRGWWGEEPPYHGPVFVLTHYPREPLEMSGGTTFHFVTEGLESALAQAREAAGDDDISIAGGAETLNQCLAAGVVDELRLHVAPFTAGDRGSRLFAGTPPLDLQVVAARHTPHVTHLTYRR